MRRSRNPSCLENQLLTCHPGAEPLSQEAPGGCTGNKVAEKKQVLVLVLIIYPSAVGSVQRGTWLSAALNYTVKGFLASGRFFDVCRESWSQFKMHPNSEMNSEKHLQYHTLQLGGRLGPDTEEPNVAGLILFI